VSHGEVGFGIIGLGRISRAHVNGLQDATGYARITAVCDKDKELADRVAREVGAKPYTDYTALLADADVTAIDAPLPHNLHYEVATRALEAGKHVLLEKPMAPTSRECAQLIELARAKCLLFSVAENTPFVTAYQAVHELLKSGTIGEVRLIRTLISGSEVARLNDTASWKGRSAGTVGGAIFDAGPHSFYLLKWLFGEVALVQAIANKAIEVSEVEDNAVVAGRMASGAFFTTEYTFTAEIPWDERLEIYGSTGSVIVDQLLDPPAVLYRGKTDVVGNPIAGVGHDPTGWKQKSIMAGVAAFARAVAEGKPPQVDPVDAMYAIKVIESSYASVREGGRPVPVI
jgi:UDP-N-acetylglucosamine 3-dehydrogenase